MNTKLNLFPLFVLLLFLCFASGAQEKHDYQIAKYNTLHYSQAQEKFRNIHPMPAGVVYIQHPNDGEEEMRAHFKLMKELGFNCLKQIMTVPGWTLEDIQLIALDEGIVPWWYNDAGWEAITDELLNKLDIPLNTPIAEIRNNKKMKDYQHNVLKERILRNKAYRAKHGDIPSGSAKAFEASIGGRGLELSEKGKAVFVEWAKNHYKSIEKLNNDWCLYHHGLGTPFESWDDFSANWETKASHRNYKSKLDILLFKAEYGADNLRGKIEEFVSYDPHQPFRGGGEMGLFLPAAYMGVDMEKLADVVKDYGSFYPSTHLSWHFNLTQNEVVRPFYMQASIMNDFNKGGWTGGWESTGGPQQFDGEKTASKLNAYYVHGGTILQLYMSQMAAGFKGFGIWCWNARSAGKEGGEYSLLDRNNQPTNRAVTLGKMAKAMDKYRDEIWTAHKEPVVGVLLDWNNDAVWAAMSVRGRDDFRFFPIEARIGAARAFINANIPFEFVTPDDIKNGLVQRYQVIYLPAIISLDQKVFEILDDFVANGGRLVLDLPTGKFDDNTAITQTGKGSRFEKIFGATLDNYQFSGSNITIGLQGKNWTGFVADMTLTDGSVLAKYTNNQPAIIENKYGKGTATVIGLDVSHQCFLPGNELAESILVENTLGELESPYSCKNALVYRLSSPNADHYYFINDGAAKTVSLSTKFNYKNVVDALTGRKVDVNAVSLKADDARWLRMEK
jgi:beta-galactosidase